MKKCIGLFITMLKIGLFTFGGGYAMLALLESEFVEKKKHMEKDEFLNMVAISESTPGPIAINAATYIGYRVSGVWGSITATIGVCIPSFLIIYIISLFLDKFLTLSLVEYAFRGIQVCVVYLIFSAGFKMLKQMEKTAFAITVVVLIVAAMILSTLFAINFSTIFCIIICGCAGVSAYLLKCVGKDKREKK